MSGVPGWLALGPFRLAGTRAARLLTRRSIRSGWDAGLWWRPGGAGVADANLISMEHRMEMVEAIVHALRLRGLAVPTRWLAAMLRR
ncbi:hypothetical protein GCM10027614_70870 [Micromonospora vulcania]